MSNEITKPAANLPASIADLFTVDAVAEDLSGGVTGGFAIVSIRGSKWRIKHQGNEEPVVNEEGEPKPSLEVVLVDASPKLSKIYYAENYSEGDAEAPDCSSINGEFPDAGVPNKQSDNCATCTHNQWGSRITESGKKAKACHDSRRIAVVPLGDLVNETYGGPMLLRVPAASLGDLKTFDSQLRGKGINYRTIGVRLGFDLDASYPKLTFKAVRLLNQDELTIVAEHITSGAAGRVLDQNETVVTPAAEPAPKPAPEPKPETKSAVDITFEEDPSPEGATEKAPPKKKAAKKKEEAAPAPAASSDIDDELDGILGDLDNLS